MGFPMGCAWVHDRHDASGNCTVYTSRAMSGGPTREYDPSSWTVSTAIAMTIGVSTTKKAGLAVGSCRHSMTTPHGKDRSTLRGEKAASPKRVVLELIVGGDLPSMCCNRSSNI